MKGKNGRSGSGLRCLLSTLKGVIKLPYWHRIFIKYGRNSIRSAQHDFLMPLFVARKLRKIIINSRSVRKYYDKNNNSLARDGLSLFYLSNFRSKIR